MAQYLPLPDGSFVTVREGETPLQAYERATKEYPDAFGIKPPAPKEGIGAAFQGGLEGLLSRARTGAEAIFDPEGAARRGLERSEAIGQEFAPGASLQRVKDVYAERGLLPAAGEVISQVPTAFAEQFPNIAATLASAKTGALAGARFGPKGALIGGVGGAVAPSLLQLFGSNIERQAEEGADISRGRALAAAAPGAALEVASTFIPLGRSLVGKLLGPQAREIMERGSAEAREAIAQESLLKVLGKGTAVGALVEIPTEVTQQMLERLQAGLPITSDDALAEYGEAAYGAGLVGAPFGAVGRAGQRGVARGEIAEEERKVRDEEARRAAEEEEARKASPEYRQELNAQLVEKKDRLRELEQLLKDKTLDEEVRNEAKTEAKTLKQELGELNREMKESMSKAGIAPSVEDVLKRQKTQVEQEKPIVDDFGNVVKPKTKGLTPEEEAEGYERQATKALEYFKEREDALQRLREFEDREDTARRIVEQELAQNQPFIRSQTPEGKAVPFVAYPSRTESFDPAQSRKPRGVSQDVWNASTVEEKAEMLKQDRIEQYTALLEDPQAAQDLENVQLATEQQKLNLFLADEATKDQTAQEIAQRTARGEAIVDIAEFQLAKAREQLGLGVLFLGPVRQKRVEDGVNQGVVDRYVASALEIRGLEGRKRSVAEAMPNIQKAIDTLNSERRSLTGKDIVNPDGGLTPDGIRLVQIDTKLEEIQRLLTAGAPEQLTATEQAIAGRVAGAGAEQAQPQYDPTLEKAPNAALTSKAEKANRDSLSGFLDLLSYLDDSRLIRETKNKKEFGKMPVTPFENKRDIKKARKQVVDGIVEEVAIKRALQKLRPLTPAEAKKLSAAVDSRLEELITRSQALPSGYFLKDEIIEPAQMRGTEIVKSAEVRRIDPRDLSERQFAAPEQAVKVIAEEIMQLRDTGQIYNPKTQMLEEVIPSGKRPVSVEKPILRQQFKTQKPETEAAQTNRVLEETNRVLAMPNLDPEVAQVLDRAANVLANEDVNPTFLDTVDEQVSRILRGTDQPFVVAEGAPQPRGAMLINEIRQDMDNEVAIRSAAMQDITTQGDLFAEELATTRATPAQFQRLQKSGKVTKERERIAKEKAEIAQTRRVALQAKREVDFELSMESVKQKEKEILDRIQTLAQQIKDAEGYDEVVVKNYKYQWEKSKDPAEVAAYKKEKARWDAATPDERKKMRVPIHPGSWKAVGPSTGKYTKRTAVMSDRVASQFAALDDDIKAQVALLREHEKKLKRIQDKNERRKAVEAVAQQRKLVAHVSAQQNKLDQERKKTEADIFEILTKVQTGLGLPGIRAERKTAEELAKELGEARAERKRAIKAAGAKTQEQKAAIPLKRPSKFKVAAIRSAEDVAAERREIEAEGRKRVSAGTTFQNLEKQEQQAVQALVNARAELKDFRKTVNQAKAAKGFKAFEEEFYAKDRELGAAVDAAKAHLDTIRANKKMLSEFEQVERQTKRTPAQRTLAGPRTEAQKKYTPEQLAMLTGMPANMMPKGTYFDDGETSFAIGDSKPETPVDFAEAEKRLKEIKEKFDKMMSGEVAPKKPEVDLTRRRLVQAAGAALVTPKIPASVAKAFQASSGTLTTESLMQAVYEADKWLTGVVENTVATLGGRFSLSDASALQAEKVWRAADEIVGDGVGNMLDAPNWADGTYVEDLFNDFVEANRNNPEVLQKIRRAYDVAATDIFTTITKDLKPADGKAEQAAKKETPAPTPAKKTPTLNFYPSVAQAPTRISEAMARQGLDPLTDSVKGGVLPNGDVFIIVDAHSDMLDLEQTITHELIGHYSFESMLGKDGMMELMRKVDKSFATKKNENGLENLADSLGLGDQYNAAITGIANFYADKLAKGEITEKEVLRLAKTQGLREIIAYTMEKRVDQSFMEKAKRWLQELVGAFRALLKRIGAIDAAKMSTSDLFYLMKQAHNNFTAGKPMAVMNSDGTVSFREAALAPTPRIGFDSLIANKGKVYDQIKGNVTGLAARVQFFDRLAALDALVKRGVDKGTISSLKAMDVLYFSRMADQRNNFVAQFATSGVGKIAVNKDGERMYEGGDGPSLKDVSEALTTSGIPSKDVENEFTKYLLAIRAKRVGVDKLDFTGKKVTQKDVNDILARYSGKDPASLAFQKARNLYRDYNHNLIDFVVSSGAMSKEKGEALKAPGDYVPFYRRMGNDVELVVMGEKPIRIGDIKNQPYLQELVGGETAVLPVFTSALQNTSLLTDMALKNMATRNTAYVLRDLGVAKINDGFGPANPNVIRFKVEERDKDGNLKHKEKYAIIDTKMKEELFGDIPTDLVVQGMEGIKAVMPAGIRLLGMPANWLRKFVTRDPRYAIRQIFRDSMASVLTTGANFVPVAQTLKDMATMKRTGVLEKLRERGVVGGQVITGASDDMAKILQQVASGKPGWDMAMAKLDEFAMMGDAATRVSMYNSFLRQGLSEREATFATLEAMNFGRRGLSPTVLYANTLIPFFNAGLQGLDVLYRAFRSGDKDFAHAMPSSERLRVKQKLFARGAMMALMTMAYAAVMEDEEEYKNANPDERYNNWFVPTPLGVLRVPIPFEAGLVFKGIPEGVYRMAFTDDKNSDVLKALKDLALRSVPGDIPTAIKPLIELNLNKSFFTDREIVDAGMPEDAKYQYRPNTPELIKLFGSIGLSPVQVEYFIKGYTGSMLVGLTRIFDPVLGGEIIKPDMRITDVPVLGGLFQPKDAGGLISAAYKSVRSMQAAQTTYNRLLVEDPAEAEKYFNENLNNISLASFAGQFRQEMGELTAAERSIRGAQTMTSEEKRQQLDDLRKMKIYLASVFNDIKRQTELRASRGELQ